MRAFEAFRAGVLLSFGMAFGFASQAELVVDKEIPGGNIELVRIDGDSVVVRNEMRDTEGWWFWWSFRVKGAAGRTLSFRFEKNRGWDENVSNRGACVSLDRGATWFYSEAEPFTCRGFSYTFPKDTHEVWFSMCLPYGVREWNDFVRRHAGEAALVVKTLCKSRHGRDVPMVRIGPEKPRYRVFLSSRHHCAEATATRVLEGVLEEALAATETGDWFRRNVELLAVPMMDYDGVIEGDQGKHRKPHDYNRDYTEFIWPETRAVRDLLLADGRTCDVFLDFHCPHYNNPCMHLMMRRHGRNEANQKAFAALVEKNAEGLQYRTANDCAWGTYWNCDRLYATGSSSTLWATMALPGLRFSGCYEIPFADTRPSEKSPVRSPVTPANCTAFGRSMAKCLCAFLQDASLGPVVPPSSPAGTVLFEQRDLPADGGVWPVPPELATLENGFAVEFTLEAAARQKPWAGVVQARFQEKDKIHLPFSLSSDDHDRLYFRMDTHLSQNEQNVVSSRTVFDGKPHRVRVTFEPNPVCANDTRVIGTVDGAEAFRVDRRRGRVGFSTVFANEIAVRRGRERLDGCVRDLRIVRLTPSRDIVVHDGTAKVLKAEAAPTRRRVGSPAGGGRSPSRT